MSAVRGLLPVRASQSWSETAMGSQPSLAAVWTNGRCRETVAARPQQAPHVAKSVLTAYDLVNHVSNDVL